MSSYLSLRRLSAGLAGTFALAALLAASPAAASPSEVRRNAGPTPPEAGLAPRSGGGEVEDVVDPELPPESGETKVEDVVDPELPPESGESEGGQDVGSTSTSSLDASTEPSGLSVRAGETDIGDRAGVPSVGNVPLARTGFPALAIASVGGVSILSGLGVLAMRRR